MSPLLPAIARFPVRNTPGCAPDSPIDASYIIPHFACRQMAAPWGHEAGAGQNDRTPALDKEPRIHYSRIAESADSPALRLPACAPDTLHWEGLPNGQTS